MKYLAAVCEDDARLARELAGECSRLLSSRGVEAHVDVFASAEELRSGLGKYRLLILDIELPGENGLSLARRARAAGSKAAVIFVTGCAEYALEGYDVQPVHYLIKPVDEARLADAIDRALAYSGAPETIVLRVGNRIVSLDAGDVWYIESLNRELIVHGSEVEQNFAMTLSAACEALPRPLRPLPQQLRRKPLRGRRNRPHRAPPPLRRSAPHRQEILPRLPADVHKVRE